MNYRDRPEVRFNLMLACLRQAEWAHERGDDEKVWWNLLLWGAIKHHIPR